MKCYCPKCYKEVELKDAKDKETGMCYNYWACEEHGKVEPTKYTCSMGHLKNLDPQQIKEQVRRMQEEMWKHIHGSWK